ncbi:amyloid beta A4 precursor protein-binding family B member 1-interacting protein [Danio rerio]|uniref:Amyloid beta A4 precursor protein-binding family B member 1-interacting protein n=1 Tax=Danio rerio TaxID=7955 RepID=AB1IP_DANRE|nr:amyloid beta A4 precursor protein-binding family B member 1-interacting protein [Danio rerio]Q6PFT9.1 RecName: Full=Amyloid beta A4 precursor protein-binding family B member 1-interacting protein; AltName: Full=APBB1-interacting protein 1 [Danio rerio]AAH57421.1 Amyloid beta (A4) precursor protein-binding, family B, member 1 interacting protein [Danio rerio]|eukprot:NP_956928.1 amyloid beta A4 precursor protein-binding family B member 1-interacting protein [Danio rerio]
MDDIDAMFSDMLQEMDLLTQSLDAEVDSAPLAKPPTIPEPQEMNFSIGFANFNESLNDLEDNDLDALMADLVADISATEEKFATERDTSKGSVPVAPAPSKPQSNFSLPASFDSSKPATSSNSIAAPPPPPAFKPSKEEEEEQLKADKIKLALEKLKEAKVKKLVVKVEITDGSSKTLMVDERQTVRDVMDNLFEKTHCDCNVDWSVCETNPDLQTERAFEDHENLVEPLSTWTRDTENKVLFQEKKHKYEVFKNPQIFYLWKKDKKSLKDMKEKDKEQLLEENFCGASVIVPDLEGVLYLKEDGKKSWKQRYFLLRASGLYYSPKGKTKASRDLVCLVQFDNVNVYYCKEYRIKYKAPTDHCFMLKHPQIQKESQYIKFMCCDDEWSMNLWVTGIRVAKYGKQLYDNYKAAVRKASGSASWANRTIQASSTASTPSPTPKAKAANGHAPQPPVENKVPSNQSSLPPPPPSMDFLPPPPPDPMFPPPPPAPPAPPAPPVPVSSTKVNKFPPPPKFPQSSFPPPPMDDLPPPPPPPEIADLPPDFLPPPPPSFVSHGGESLPPPPPDPVASLPPPPPAFTSAGGAPPPPPPPPPPPAPAPAVNNPAGSVRKVAPPPPKRTTPQLAAPSGGDFMSELMNAMQKKRTQP